MRMTRPAVDLEEYRAMVGSHVGTSDWVLVDQARIDSFAQTTGDHQFIHVNPVAAAKTPFGTTIAHGFLTLSLCSAFAYEALPAIKGVKMGVNYGLNKLRFMAPVKSGKRIRGSFMLKDVTQRPDGAWQSTLGISVEIEGETKPALVAEWVSLQYL